MGPLVYVYEGRGAETIKRTSAYKPADTDISILNKIPRDTMAPL